MHEQSKNIEVFKPNSGICVELPIASGYLWGSARVLVARLCLFGTALWQYLFASMQR